MWQVSWRIKVNLGIVRRPQERIIIFAQEYAGSEVSNHYRLNNKNIRSTIGQEGDDWSYAIFCMVTLIMPREKKCRYNLEKVEIQEEFK